MTSQLPKQLDVIVHIGAGRCEELDSYLGSAAQRIILVEPNPQLASELRNRSEGNSRVQVLELAVTNSPKHKQLNEYNLWNTSSLYEPTGLRKLFPGLRLLAQQPVATVTGYELLQQCALTSDQNALIIQSPGAELDIIESLTKTGNLDQFSYLSITCPEQPLYDKASDSASVLKMLQEQGFDLIDSDDTDPDWPIWTLHRNALAQKLTALTVKHQTTTEELQYAQKELAAEKTKNSELEILKQELNELTVKHQGINEELQLTRKELAAEKAKEAEYKSLKQELTALTVTHHATSEELQQAKKDLAAEKHRTEELQKKLEYQAARTSTEKLEQRMEYLFDQQRLQLEQASNALGWHVTSTVSSTAKELEAGITLQQQFGHDLPSLEEQGSELPASLALRLSRQITSKPYDAILEFGSGISTTFMARTLCNQLNKIQEARDTELAHYVDPSEDDLPKRIICFEHNRSKYSELTKKLKENGLTPVIKLQHTPLVPYQHQSQEYLYYDCASRLQQLAKLFEERQARIFVLLNNVGGDSQVSQLAALPQLLQYLSSHSLDVVVSAAVDSEQVRQWCKLLTERGLEYQQPSQFGRSDVQLLSINP